MAMMLIKELPGIPVTFVAWPRYEYEDQYYIGFSTPEYFYTWDVEIWVRWVRVNDTKYSTAPARDDATAGDRIH
jgi:hypothetical protein